MNRFEQAQPSPIKIIFRIFPFLLFAVVFILFYKGVNSASETTLAKQQESLETALSHSIAQCYAVEGHYPENLDYIVAHYGLTYDTKTFLVVYTFYGDNLYPDTTVIRKTGINMITPN